MNYAIYIFFCLVFGIAGDYCLVVFFEDFEFIYLLSSLLYLSISFCCVLLIHNELWMDYHQENINKYNKVTDKEIKIIKIKRKKLYD